MIAPSANAMPKMLRFCEQYALEYNISLCLMPTNQIVYSFLHTRRPVFHINYAVEYVEQWPYLGHVISSDLDDKHDISRCRSALVSQINNVLCFFRTNRTTC